MSSLRAAMHFPPFQSALCLALGAVGALYMVGVGTLECLASSYGPSRGDRRILLALLPAAGGLLIVGLLPFFGHWVPWMALIPLAAWAVPLSCGTLRRSFDVLSARRISRHSSEAVRARAVELSARLGGRAGASVLIRILDDPSADLRRRAAGKLVYAADRSTLPHLIAALRHSDPQVRIKVVAALGRLGDARAVIPLVDHLTSISSYDHPREAALTLETLSTLGWAPATARERAFASVASNRFTALEGEAAADAIVAALRSRQPPGTWLEASWAAELGRLRYAPAIDTLAVWARFLPEACTALGEMREPPSLPPLVLALDGTDEVAGAATRALLRFGEACIGPVARQLRDTLEQPLRTHGRHVALLRQLGPAGEQQLSVLRAAPEWEVRLSVALGSFLAGDESAALDAEPILLDRLNLAEPDGQSKFLGIAERLARLGTPAAVSALIEAVERGGKDRRNAALSLLARSGNLRAVPYLLSEMRGGCWLRHNCVASLEVVVHARLEEIDRGLLLEISSDLKHLDETLVEMAKHQGLRYRYTGSVNAGRSALDDPPQAYDRGEVAALHSLVLGELARRGHEGPLG